MHWMAAPDAPLPRLSNRAISSARSSLPATRISMESRPARRFAPQNAGASPRGGNTFTSFCPA